MSDRWRRETKDKREEEPPRWILLMKERFEREEHLGSPQALGRPRARRRIRVKFGKPWKKLKLNYLVKAIIPLVMMAAYLYFYTPYLLASFNLNPLWVVNLPEPAGSAIMIAVGIATVGLSMWALHWPPEAVKEHVKQLEDYVKRLSWDRTELEHKLGRAERKVADLESQLKSIRRELEDVLRERDHLEAELSRVKRDKEHLEGQLSVLREQASRLEEERTQLAEELRKKEAELDVLREKVSTLEEFRNRYSKAVEEALRKLGKLVSMANEVESRIRGAGISSATITTLDNMLNNIREYLSKAGALLNQEDAMGFLASLDCLNSVLEDVNKVLTSYVHMVEEEMPEKLKEKFDIMRERVRRIVDAHARSHDRNIPDLLLNIADSLFDRALLALSEKRSEEAAGYIKAALYIISCVEGMYKERWWLQLMRALKELA